ncbi:MAG: cupin-like domain-containing protein, partial [Acidimicrobiia bacterium]
MRSGPPAAAPGPGEPEVADLEVADIGLVAADLLAAGRPAVLRGGARSWPAFERWDFEQLAATVGPTPVVCEVGDITRETRPLVEVAFDEYARAVARGDYDGTRTYASQLDLLALAPELSADLDLRALAGKRLLVRRAWIGPAGTVTGWHRDHVD